MSPVQAIVLASDLSNVEGNQISATLCDRALSKVRVQVEPHLNRQQLNQELKLWTQRKVPLVILLFGTAEERHAEIKCVAIRGDTGEECKLQDIVQLSQFIPEILTTISDSLERSARHELGSAAAAASSMEQVSRIRQDGKIAVAPVQANENTIRALETQVRGEILGLATNTEMAPCVISGSLTHFQAIVAPRL